MDELKKLVESLNVAFAEYKKINDQRLDEIKKTGASHSNTETKLAKAEQDIERLSQEREKLQTEIDGVKTALNRSGGGADDGKKTDPAKLEAKDAFRKFITKGKEHMTVDEMKRLAVSDDTTGGYLVMPEIEAGIIRNLANLNAVRTLANVRTISKGDALEQRRRTAGITMTWAGEQSPAPAGVNPTFGNLRIAAEQGMVKVTESAQILEDALFDVDAWIQMEAAEAFANGEGSAFLTGTGTGKPRGILTYAAGTADGQVEQVNSGTAAALADVDGQANGLLSLVYKLKAAYAKNGAFILNRATVGAIRKLKDNQKNYIWSPGLGTQPATILGYRYEEDDNMAVEGANNLIVIFADFKRFYKVVDRVGMSIIRDPYSAKPDVEFLFRKRVGGAVEIFEAGKILKCST